MKIKNLIPKNQSYNQSFENIEYILQPHNLISDNYEVNKTLKQLSNLPDAEIVVRHGIYTREGDSWHFNIDLYYKNQIIDENLHVYVHPIVTADSLGNPYIFWIFDSERKIT